MSLPPGPLPFLDRPDLKPGDDRGGPVVEPKHPEAMVRFRDGTLRLCKLTGWRKDSGGWACRLQWGASGRVASGWYRPDAEKMEYL